MAVCAPHTSNVDYLMMLAVSWYQGFTLSFLGKDSLFNGPIGIIMRMTGGVPVDRRSPQGLVGQLVDRFAENPDMVLAVPAEGTRRYSEYWKSGFYRIAVAADVPICLAFVDRATKTTGCGPMLRPSGDLAADMDVIREFYGSKVGWKPENFGPIRLRDEEPAESDLPAAG